MTQMVFDQGAFMPLTYAVDLTMNNTAQGIALAATTSLGKGRIRVTNLGATTEAIRVAFGTSELNAEANLTIDTNRATTGVYVPAAIDGLNPTVLLAAPHNATHFAVANAVAGDTQVVAVEQGL